MNTLSIGLPPPLTYQTSNHPPPDRLFDDCPVLLKYPDEFISNTKVVRNRSTRPDTPPLRVSDVHDTSDMIPPPPDTLSGNHPEPIFHPRMISRSELIVSYYVRASI